MTHPQTFINAYHEARDEVDDRLDAVRMALLGEQPDHPHPPQPTRPSINLELDRPTDSDRVENPYAAMLPYLSDAERRYLAAGDLLAGVEEGRLEPHDPGVIGGMAFDERLRRHRHTLRSEAIEAAQGRFEQTHRGDHAYTYEDSQTGYRLKVARKPDMTASEFHDFATRMTETAARDQLEAIGQALEEGGPYQLPTY